MKLMSIHSFLDSDVIVEHTTSLHNERHSINFLCSAPAFPHFSQ